MNVEEIEQSVCEIAKKQFQPETFIYEVMEAYFAPPSLIKQLQTGNQNFSDLEAGVLWRRNLHFKKANEGQVYKEIENLEKSESSKKYKVKYIISTDGNEFYSKDLINGTVVSCLLNELGTQFRNFLPLAGIYTDQKFEESPIDIQATERLTKFYDCILQDNPDWRLDENRDKLNHFITQIIFCLFAEDTEVIEENLFSDTIRIYCADDSSKAKTVIENIFVAMAFSNEDSDRKTLPNYSSKFPHVNGTLFRGSPHIPRMTRGSVRYLLDASMLDWKEINPDIFGSMIQAIVNQDRRGELGMHYTSVTNIVKVLNPLFLDDLESEIKKAWNSKNYLISILKRLTKIRVFDPACGSGNFLVIAYRKLREIEIEILRRLADIDQHRLESSSYVKLSNFYGIEITDFAAETAGLSLWIAEFQMNKLLEDEFCKPVPSLPLKSINNIINQNAVRVDWVKFCGGQLLPDTEIYVVGNPPFIGSNFQNKEQKEDLALAAAGKLTKYKNLDYVSCWILKSVEFLKETDAKVGVSFVTTNSICQGIHVPILWKYIYQENFSINFAYPSFKWRNLATHVAGITVIIFGLSNYKTSKKYIFGESSIKYVTNISPYLIEGPNIIIDQSSKPISNLPTMTYGNKAVDGGNLILDSIEFEEFAKTHPMSIVEKFSRRLLGSQEFIKGFHRYCLWIHDQDLAEAMSVPFIRNRIEKTKNMRLKSKDKGAQALATRSHQFRDFFYSEKSLIIPRVFSENRIYLQVGFLKPDCIISDRAFAIYNAPTWCIAVLSSRLHYLWASTVCGRLRSDINYSNTLAWNTFPIPELCVDNVKKLDKSAEAILLAREHYFDKVISELYDPNRMQNEFPKLWDAHLENDLLIENIYNGEPFYDDPERLQYLFDRYLMITKANL